METPGFLNISAAVLGAAAVLGLAVALTGWFGVKKDRPTRGHK